ncbi:1-phosphofructokinase family hexose kinase [Spirochaeta isovalerica]|uniref:1-phosphofructokinase n=1 Tax=Spirochaeta isovalerica TaxID=150 RepID=A0A841RC45_9SPIO|nr:1-phosphofructokinase family hexose kinase [Spirochaeta isovalerica]MBB6481555.1 1-phosphofructokinase [Spirochaeta isovalerica]
MSKKILTVTLNPAIDYTVIVPGFAVDSVNRAESGRRDPGGKGINVATALSRGGFDVAVTGFLGKENALIFRDHFTKNSLEDHFVYVEGSTREGIKIADPEGEITTDINFPGFMIEKKQIDELLDKFGKLASGFHSVILSGSLPPGVPDSFYGDLAKIAREAGCFVALDTSRMALKAAVETGAINLIKPNIDELAEIYEEIRQATDRPRAVDALSLKLLEKVDMIALSLGEEGSRLYGRGYTIDASAPAIKVKSTVGAGDTFLAGFAGALASGLEKGDALKQAASWAASKLTMYGSGLSEVQPPASFLDKIKIKIEQRGA